MYVVSRQRQWPEGKCVVEVSRGSIDYVNPDALKPIYEGELCEYADPREAVTNAVAICKAWRRDGQKNAKIGIGFTYGATLPLDTCSFERALGWADGEYELLPKCPQCDCLMPGNSRSRRAAVGIGMVYSGPYYGEDGEEYCSERCAEKYCSLIDMFDDAAAVFA